MKLDYYRQNIDICLKLWTKCSKIILLSVQYFCVNKRFSLRGNMDYRIIYDNWITNPCLSSESVSELESIKNDDKEIEYRFGGELQFGTAGMRGLIGIGTNMMNVYTVKRATQGLAQYIKTLGQSAMLSGVVISYDTRRQSVEFALAAAGVLLKNDINVYIYKVGRPVPMLSYAVRKLGCIAGIMITASHNPKEYNGYKVYGSDGAQMSPEATAEVVKYITDIKDYFSVESLNIANIKAAAKLGANLLGKFFESKYYKEVAKLSLSKQAVKRFGKKIKLVYTPIHGTGYTPVTTVLKRLGINATIVEEQVAPDTEFSTVEVPNPEYKETLSMGIELANEIKADVVFGTDPDCDRLGVAIRDNEGAFATLTGNQVGVLLLNYILTRLKQENKLPADAFAVKSFVSTGLAKAVADSYGVELKETPVGFKFIGEKIKEAEESGVGCFVFGFEESCGYLRGTHARDKDAVVASMLFAEMVCYYNSISVSVFDVLNEIYEKFGYCLDRTVSIAFSGLNAMSEMSAAVEAVSNSTVDKIGKFNVVATRDYENGTRTLANGEIEALEYSKLNCLYFELENGGFVCLRPSGTEPKLKVYYSVYAKDKLHADMAFEELTNGFEEILKK